LGSPHARRVIAIALPTTSITLFVVQAGSGIGLLFVPENSALLRLASLALVGIYAGALARDWKIQYN
jgi:hypothetical protein